MPAGAPILLGGRRARAACAARPPCTYALFCLICCRCFYCIKRASPDRFYEPRRKPRLVSTSAPSARFQTSTYASDSTHAQAFGELGAAAAEGRLRAVAEAQREAEARAVACARSAMSRRRVAPDLSRTASAFATERRACEAERQAPPPPPPPAPPRTYFPQIFAHALAAPPYLFRFFLRHKADLSAVCRVKSYIIHCLECLTSGVYIQHLPH